MPWSVYNSTGKLLQILAIGDDSIVEGKLDVSNAPTNGYFLQAQSGEGGGLTWAAASSGPSQATQAALEAETNEDTYAPPDLIKHSPGIAKAWCKWEQSGTHSITLGYGWTSVTDGGAAGDTDHVVSTAFSSTNWLAVSMAGANHMRVSNIVSTTAFSTVTADNSHAGSDGSSNYVVMFGDL